MADNGSSLPKTLSVRGYKVERAPIGRMLCALEKLKYLPDELVKACFPGKSLDEIRTGGLNPTVSEWLTAALMAAPRFVIDFIADVTEIPAERLYSDPAVGLDGILEIADAWIEVNNLLNFTGAIHALTRVWRGMTESGSPESSQPGSESGSPSVRSLRTSTLTKLMGSLRSTRGS
ncbi:hypothetical protein AGMMS49992_33330 [Clostridia bacterium]|nr:hypothetical protein AGMMS49992_33330 [Clostridia bacterium]